MATGIVKQAGEVLVEHERTRYGDWYTGTKAALIAAGHAKAGQFPGEPGCGKTATSFDSGGKPLLRGRRAGSGAALKVHRWGKDRFAVFKPISAVDKAVLDDLESVYQAVARPKWGEAPPSLCEFERQPATREAFSERAASVVWTVFQAAVASETSGSGFRFRRADVEACRELANELYWAIKKAKPVFDYPTRACKLLKARKEAEQQVPRYAWRLRLPVETVALLDIDGDHEGATA